MSCRVNVEDVQCSICQDILQKPVNPATGIHLVYWDFWTERACIHAFCLNCLKDWTKNNDTCPQCRKKFNCTTPDLDMTKRVSTYLQENFNLTSSCYQTKTLPSSENVRYWLSNNNLEKAEMVAMQISLSSERARANDMLAEHYVQIREKDIIKIQRIFDDNLSEAIKIKVFQYLLNEYMASKKFPNLFKLCDSFASNATTTLPLLEYKNRALKDLIISLADSPIEENLSICSVLLLKMNYHFFVYRDAAVIKLASLYFDLGNIDKSLELFQTLEKKDEAQVLFKKLFESLTRTGESKKVHLASGLLYSMGPALQLKYRSQLEAAERRIRNIHNCKQITYLGAGVLGSVALLIVSIAVKRFFS